VLQEVFGKAGQHFLEASLPFAIAGYTAHGIPVTFPVGDNQAGFFGMVSQWESSALISLGTSGQISLFSKSPVCPDSMELRPFFGQGYLHVGATLTAGKAYETLQKFLMSVFQSAQVAITDEQVFDLMKLAAVTSTGDESLVVDTRLTGTRKDPSARGAIRNIGLDNFTLGNLVGATVDGIIGELKSFTFDAVDVFSSISKIVATGSSVRKNHLFSESLNRVFAMPTSIAQVDDGAGFGSALIGAVATGAVDIDASRNVVHEMLGT
jgi:sedoheptulokinase